MDPVVANSLGSSDPPDSVHSMFSSLSDSLKYYQDIRSMRTEDDHYTPSELGDVIASMGRGLLSVIDLEEIQSSDGFSNSDNKQSSSVSFNNLVSSESVNSSSGNLTDNDKQLLTRYDETIESRGRRIQVLFEGLDNDNEFNQSQTHIKPLPLWFEVPDRPTNVEEIRI